MKDALEYIRDLMSAVRHVDTDQLLERMLDNTIVCTGDDADARRQCMARQTWPQLPIRSSPHPAEYAASVEFLDMRRFLRKKIAERIGADATEALDDELRIRHRTWMGEAGERWIADLRREADRSC